MSETRTHVKRSLGRLVIASLGVAIGLAIASLSTSGPTAMAAVRDVQGVSVRMCSEGVQIYGTDFGWMFSAEREPLFEVSKDPDQLVMLDGTRIEDIEKIEGTDSFREPNRADPTRADVVYEVRQVRPGEYAVVSVIACDYDTMHQRTGYQP